MKPLINHRDMAKMQVETEFGQLQEEFTLAQKSWIRQTFDEAKQEDKKLALILLAGKQRFFDLAIDLQLYLKLEYASGNNEHNKDILKNCKHYEYRNK